LFIKVNVEFEIDADIYINLRYLVADLVMLPLFVVQTAKHKYKGVTVRLDM